MSTLLTKIAADFTTQLATAISVGGTTATLLSQTDDDGNTLPDGNYTFTLDGASSNKEHIRCVKTGTSLTSIQSLSRQGALTSGVVRAHRIGCSVVITDWAQLKYLTDLLTGTTDLDSTNPLKYDGTATISNDAHLATKKYVDDTAIAGSPKATDSVYGIAKLSVAAVSGTDPIAVGDNDTRIPTQDENNALAGTSGTPSTSNKYVTNDDTATAATADKVARRLANGNVTVVTETTGNNTTNAASTAFVNASISANTPQTRRQPIISNGSGSGSVLFASCSTSGFSTTEPFFVAVSGASASNYLARYVKLSNGDVIKTHSATVGGSAAASTMYLCVLGNYVYVAYFNGSSVNVKRYDKADLTNETTMTISGTALSSSTAIFTDGTDIYNMYTAGTARKYTISGTTLTSSTTVSYTSSAVLDNYWSDGTSVYAINVSSGATYKWALAGGARTTGTTFFSGEVLFAGGTIQTSAGGILKESGNTSYVYVLGTAQSVSPQVGGIIPITFF